MKIRGRNSNLHHEIGILFVYVLQTKWTREPGGALLRFVISVSSIMPDITSII